ncbi:MAG: hypothetical protein ACR2H4_07100 [Pyrinomonadaceae bacterium]
MKYLKFFFLALVAAGLFSMAAAASNAASVSQTQSTALERGYRTGYSDGYNAGYRDVSDRAPRDYQRKDEYQRADRTYNKAWGTLEDYKDGYQQGFEEGYATGYDRGNFNSSIPTGLSRRGTVNSAPDDPSDNSQPSSSAPVGNNGPVFIPRDSVLTIELQSSLSTEASQPGDPFQARIVTPSEFAGATIEGRVVRVKRAGKVKGSSQLQLSFDSIRMADGRSSPFNASVVEIVHTGSSDDSGTVDSEGGVKGRSSTKDDVSKVGASAGVGAILGAIFGGAQGAAIGAAIGGSVGTAGVLTSRGRDLRLERGQQLKIRTENETRIQ